MKKLFATILSALAVAASASAATVEVGYPLKGDLIPWGTGKTEVYNAAIKVDDPGLVGRKVTAIQFTWQEGVEATGCKAFLASELKLKSGVATGDIAEAEYTPVAGVCTVTLAEPWTIDRGTFYAGYTFKVGSPAGNEALAKPILLGLCDYSDACFFASSRTFRGWQQPAALQGGGFTVRVLVEGDFAADAAGVKSISAPVCTPVDPAECTVTIANHGTAGINNIDYTFTVAGQSVSGSQTFAAPVSAEPFGSTASFTFTAPAVAELGAHDGTFTITKVNGVDNTDTAASAQLEINVSNQVMKHVVVMEEFTGTWCQWCVRGLVAMRLLNQQLGDSFIALAYHNGDPMTITNSYPVDVEGFPCASIDRGPVCDPYYGTGNADLGVLNLINANMAQAVPANISVSAQYNEDETAVNIDASAYFFADYAQNPYRLAYVLTADGLNGPVDNADWYQSNAYYNKNAAELPGGEEFCKPNGQSLMYLTYDDVVVAYSPYGGEAGSLPDAVQFDNSYSHTYSFDISDIYENKKPGTPLIQHKDKVYVNVLLIDTTTGRIVNAGKCHVEGAKTGVSDLRTGRTVESVDYFDLSGRRLEKAPAAGFVIERTRYTDGSTTTAKRAIR